MIKQYKKYISFFRLRFAMGLQYRAAALAGIATQFAWRFMEINVFRAFYSSNVTDYPMTMSQLATYIWLQQALLAFWAVWMVEGEIFDSITEGTIAYELCRPLDIYNMWFARSMATRLSRAVLRCLPILLLAFLLPAPYRMVLPENVISFVCFLISTTLGLSVTVALCMLIYSLTFFVISPQGLRILFVSSVEFFEGAVIPLPFFPTKLRIIMELLPFASMQNVPLRIYSGSIDGVQIFQSMLLQVFWLFILIAAGKMICSRAIKNVVVQGG